MCEGLNPEMFHVEQSDGDLPEWVRRKTAWLDVEGRFGPVQWHSIGSLKQEGIRVISEAYRELALVMCRHCPESGELKQSMDLLDQSFQMASAAIRRR